MKISYYPGCTLKNKARDLDRYARESAAVLGYEFEEIENWQCCGGAVSYTHLRKRRYTEHTQIFH